MTSESFLSKPHSSRMLVDLVYHLSHGYFLNTEPISPIRVGDYGTVDSESGKLVIEGNIYTDFDATNAFGIIASETHDPEEKLVLMSESGVRKDIDFEIESDDRARSALKMRFEVEFPVHWQQSVTLVLIQPRSTEIPRPGKLAKLVSKRELLHKVVVDQVVMCPAYALIVTASTGGKVDISFAGETQTPEGRQKAELHGRWDISISDGYERSACFPTAECHVLYRLKLITKRGIKAYTPDDANPEDILDTRAPVERHPMTSNRGHSRK